MLARGDRRGFVVVDKFGQVHSLSRYVKGHTAKQIKAKLAPLTAGATPDRRSGERADAASAVRRRRIAEFDRLREQRRAALEKRFAENQAKRRGRTRRRRAGASRPPGVREARFACGAAAREVEASCSACAAPSPIWIGRTPALRSVLGHIQKLTHLDPKERHRLGAARRSTLARHARREAGHSSAGSGALAKIEAREMRFSRAMGGRRP